MQSIVKNALKRQAKIFSQSSAFKEHLKEVFDDVCDNRAGVTNREVYTIVLQMYICESAVSINCVCLIVCLFVCLFVCVFVCLCVCVFVCLCVMYVFFDLL
jgi:hypothetical protein